MKEQIEELIQPIVKRFEEDEKYFGGYAAIRHFHDSAPEDYIEERTEWSTLRNYADDMYYMLSVVEEQIGRIKEFIEAEL